MEGRGIRIALRVWAIGVMAFVYIPLAVIVMASFDSSRITSWPIQDYSTKWYHLAWGDERMREALVNSLTVGLRATVIALLLGSAVAFALHRFRFFGKDALSFLLVLPIALPGIITGLSLLSTISYLNITPSLWTVVVGHATFCIVVVYNNAIARLRRTSMSLEEASADLGADSWQTFRFVTFPQLRSALIAGALLAFALSFDEVIVTTFTAGAGVETLPLWILNNLSRPNQLPVVNVTAVIVILLSAIPVYFAQRLMDEPAGVRGAR